MSGPVLTVKNLAVRTADGGTLVRDFGFSLARGETIGIVGESGSGKSIAMRAIMGLLPGGLQATGEVRLGEKDMLRPGVAAAHRGKRITMMFQDPFTMLNPLQRAGTTLSEALRNPGRSEIERRLSEVGIDDPGVARRYPFELSGGLRQRVGLAAALANDPEILIADEPSTALDVTTQAEIVELLSKTGRDRGMGLVLITHDLRLAFSACDRVLVLYAGALLEAGRTEEIAAMPRHPYTLGLLLSEPRVDRRVRELYAIPGAVPPADDVLGRCPFADRCDWAEPACRSKDAVLHSADGVHSSACLRQAEIAGEIAERQNRSQISEPGREASEEAAEPLVRVSGLAKSFGKMRVLKGVDLAIYPGECLGLVGESGSGKSTIARCLMGLERADAGEIMLESLLVADPATGRARDLAAFRRSVQFVFQDPYATLNPRHSIRKCFDEILRADGRPDTRDEEKTALLQQVGLTPAYLDRRPAQLSGGERQRIAIARALALGPKLLICDEAVSALDVSVQAQILNLLKRLARERGLAYLFVTHDLAVVRQIADRVAVLEKGRIIESGPVDRVMDAPREPYTKALLSSLPGRRDCDATSDTV
jgi:peptide/nickel transport system ATP-binding protein